MGYGEMGRWAIPELPSPFQCLFLSNWCFRVLCREPVFGTSSGDGSVYQVSAYGHYVGYIL